MGTDAANRGCSRFAFHGATDIRDNSYVTGTDITCAERGQKTREPTTNSHATGTNIADGERSRLASHDGINKLDQLARHMNQYCMWRSQTKTPET